MSRRILEVAAGIAAAHEIIKKEKEKKDQKEEKTKRPLQEKGATSQPVEKIKEKISPSEKREIKSEEQIKEERVQSRKKSEIERILKSKGHTLEEYNTPFAIPADERLAIRQEAEEKTRFIIENEKIIEVMAKQIIKERFPNEDVDIFIGGQKGFEIREEAAENLWQQHSADKEKIKNLQQKINQI